MNLDTFLRVLNISNNLSVDEILDMLIIYLRKSRKDSDYYKDEPIEKTLQRHEKDLQDFITRIFGKPIPEKNIYREVVSGDIIEDRPVMQQILSLIENDSVKGVICIEIERLARGNTIDQGIIAQTFQYTKTKIITPMKIYDLDNEDDLSYFEDGLFQSRKYLKYTKRILARGRVRSVKEGKYVGSVLPYGYNKIKLENEKGYMLVQNKDEAQVVKLMANLFLEGLHTTYIVKENDTVSTIAKLFGLKKQDVVSTNLDLKINTHFKLTIDSKNVDYVIKENDTLYSIAEKYNIKISDIHYSNNLFKPGETIKIIIDDMRTTNLAHYLDYLQIKPRKSANWSAFMVRNILTSPTVYGYLTWDKRKTVKYLENGKVVKKNPKSNNYLFVKGKHYDDKILDEDIKAKIEWKFKNNRVKTIPDNKEIKNPLLGLVKCGYCGSNMTRRPYYYIKENKKETYKRVYHVDKHNLKLLLREYKGNLSLNDIALKLGISKNIVDHWFAANDEKFTIPCSNKWYELKKLLNIETDEFDKAITTLEKKDNQPHEDTLICSHLRCKCVGSNLSLVEKRIINALKDTLIDYENYISNYSEEVKKEININKELLDINYKEINKINSQLEKCCELVETGTYTQEIFIKRTSSLKEQLKVLQNKKNELSKEKDLTKEYNIKKKTIPKLKYVLENYKDNLKPEEKNILLSTVIKQVIYTKEKGGVGLKDNFTIRISLLQIP